MSAGWLSDEELRTGKPRASRPGARKWTPGDLPAWYAEIPKAVLFVIARQIAATAEGSCDDFDAGERAILQEWEAQHAAGYIPQRPPKAVRS